VVLHDVCTLRWSGCLRVWALVRQLAYKAGVGLPLQPDDPGRRCPDITRARRLLDWRGWRTGCSER
jgi:hypothetical protein